MFKTNKGTNVSRFWGNLAMSTSQVKLDILWNQIWQETLDVITRHAHECGGSRDLMGVIGVLTKVLWGKTGTQGSVRIVWIKN